MSAWSDRQGLTTHYVDNCWARIVVTRDELGRFYEDHGLTRPEGRVARTPCEAYVIEAEEF